MPRVTELVGYGFAVAEVQVPDVDPRDGQPRRNARGEVKMIPAKRIMLRDPMGDAVVITLDGKAKDELVRQLTGGVAVASSITEVVKH